MDTIILIFGIIFLVIIMFFSLKNNLNFKEDFDNLMPGVYPESDTKGILNNFYKWNSPTKVSNLNYNRQVKDYPIYPANSNKNNNLEYWSKPINGTCYFPELCGNMYQSLSTKIQKEKNTQNIDNFPNCYPNNRVNLWCSSK